MIDDRGQAAGDAQTDLQAGRPSPQCKPPAGLRVGAPLTNPTVAGRRCPRRLCLRGKILLALAITTPLTTHARPATSTGIDNLCSE